MASIRIVRLGGWSALNARSAHGLRAGKRAARKNAAPLQAGARKHGRLPAAVAALLVTLVLALFVGQPAYATPGPLTGKIAFAGTEAGFGTDIYAMNADGSSVSQLTSMGWMLGWAYQPAWSPDGSRIAFAHFSCGTLSCAFWNGEIYVMNADGSGVTFLTGGQMAWPGDPAWSPDGTKIVFGSWGGEHWDDGDLYVMNSFDGSGQTNLTNNEAWDGQPTWSPDGERIAFASDRDGSDEVYVMNADGSEQTRLTESAALDSEPAWSPDGSKIAFASDRDGNDEVYVMNTDGSGQTRLTSNPASDSEPAWSSDGSMIAFVRGSGDDPATNGILVMNADGTDEAVVNRDPPYYESSPSWQSGEVPPDTTPPETVFDPYGPPPPDDPTTFTSATFGFSSEGLGSQWPGSTFECDRDGLGYESCESPKEYADLADGSHTFSVRATDEAENTDPTPATYTWIVDTTPITPPPPPPPDTGGPTALLGTTSGAPLDTVGPTVRISRGKVRLTRRGLARVRLSCPASEPDDHCSGTLTLRATVRARTARQSARGDTVTLGQGNFSIRRGWTAAVKVRLSRKSRRLVKRLGRPTVEATAAARDAAANSVTTTRAFVLEAPPVWG